MKLLRKAIVLGVAGLGLYKTYEVVAPKLGAARGRTAQARRRAEPAVKTAKDTFASARDSVRDTASSLVGASKDVVDVARDPVVDVGNDVATDPSPGIPSRSESDTELGSDIDSPPLAPSRSLQG
jgi:ElaB/YqjD/DUF883 family membrane-anchored ribosome-binding protein